MIAIRRPIFLLHQDEGFRERVLQACEGHYEMYEPAGWEPLRAALAKAPPGALAVVDPYVGDRLAPGLRALLRELPSSTVVAACEVRRGGLEDVRTMGEWGVSRVICLGEEDTPVALLSVLRAAGGRPMRGLLARSLPASMPGRARAIVMSTADIVISGGYVRDLARSLRITPRTLQRWCRRAGLPAPRPLLAWMRLLLAAELLDDAGRSVGNVAMACGYSSDAALRNALRGFLGTTPNALRAQGAFRIVSAGFQDALAEAAAADRPPEPGSRRDATVIPLRPRTRSLGPRRDRLAGRRPQPGKG